MHTTIVGNVGSGKTVLAQKVIDDGLARNPDGTVKEHERIYSLTPITSLSGAPVTVIADRENWWKDVRCGVVFLDEVHRLLWSRKYGSMVAEAMEFLTMHRHEDVHIVTTTQHSSFMDKSLRILTDNVLIPNVVSVPLLGLLAPSSVRPPHRCRHGEHSRRDALGDHCTAFRRALRFGTVLTASEYSPAALLDVESTEPDELAAAGIEPRSRDWWLWRQSWADAAQGLPLGP